MTNKQNNHSVKNRTKLLTNNDKIQIALKKQHKQLKPLINTYKLEILKQSSLTNVTFKRLCEICQTSEGNIANITKLLEKDGLIQVKKEFVGKYPQTSYRATKEGIVVLVNLEKFVIDVMSLVTLKKTENTDRRKCID